MPNFNPPKWGGGTTSKDYEMLMEGASPLDEPISLVGHSLTGLTPETIDAVTLPVVEKVRGKIINKVRTLRPQQVTGLTGTLGFGNANWTPLLQKARQSGGECETTIYLKRLCPPDSDERLAIFYPNTTFSQPTFVNDPVTIDETNPIEWQSEFRAENQYILWGQGGYELTDLSDPLYAIATLNEECVACDDSGVYQQLVVAGGTTTVHVRKTDDRFGTSTILDASAAPSSRVAKAVWSEGDVILVGFASTENYLTSTVGGTLFTADGGDTAMALDSNITVPVNGVTKFGGQYVAVGGVGGGQAHVWTSSNGRDWTDLSSGALPATQALAAIDVDEENGVFYAVGENGLVLKGRLAGSSIALTALTPDNVSTTDLYAVHVFGDDHMALGGASGYYAESFDGGDTWEQPSFPGTNTVYAIGGVDARAVVQSGTTFYVRDVLTNNAFESFTDELRDGATVTGVIRGIFVDRNDVNDGHNYFAAVTADGEVYQLRPLYPNS